MRRPTLSLALLIAGCGSGGGATPPDDGSVPPPDAAPLPTGPLTLYGAGPDGVDNGVAEACTGPTGDGRQVLCVDDGASIAAAIAIARDGDLIQVSEGT